MFRRVLCCTKGNKSDSDGQIYKGIAFFLLYFFMYSQCILDLLKMMLGNLCINCELYLSIKLLYNVLYCRSDPYGLSVSAPSTSYPDGIQTHFRLIRSKALQPKG